MTPDRPIRWLRGACFVSVVSLASMFFGACWGQWAGMMYAWSPIIERPMWSMGGPQLVLSVAVALGWTSGLAVALIWCSRWIRRHRHLQLTDPHRSPVRHGCLSGAVAGLASTLIVHVGVATWAAVALGKWVGSLLVFGLALGLPTGLVTGLAVGWCGTALGYHLLTADLGDGGPVSGSQPGGRHGEQYPADEEERSAERRDDPEPRHA